jgi:hypothetical protein
MKPIKMLGLAVVAAIAAMAMVGPASALAKNTVELCKVANQTPCEPANLYSFSPTNPLSIKTNLVPGTEAKLTGSIEVHCKKSTVNGKALENQSNLEKEQQIVGEITEVSWTECSGPLGACTATAVQLPWTVHLNQKPNLEQNNGDMYVGPKPVSTGGQPGAIIICAGIECEFKVEEEQPEETNGKIWGKLQVLGGAPAHVTATNLKLKLVRRNSSLCGALGAEKGTWNAEYEVTEPAEAAYVTHQNT